MQKARTIFFAFHIPFDFMRRQICTYVQLFRCAALQLPFFQLKFEDFRVADEKKEKQRSLEDEAWN